MNKDYDNLLYIDTTNAGARPEESPHYNHYEATPYAFLHALFEEYKLEKTDHFVDFGSGKGRLLFYVHNLFGTSMTGVEMNEYLHKKAQKNKKKYFRKAKRKHDDSIHLECCLAEKYVVKDHENIFYFFNPFSVQIFMKVIGNILDSVERKERVVDLILYYPKIEYIHFLENKTGFELVQEVKVPGLYEINKNERFLVFRKFV